MHHGLLDLLLCPPVDDVSDPTLEDETNFSLDSITQKLTVINQLFIYKNKIKNKKRAPVGRTGRRRDWLRRKRRLATPEPEPQRTRPRTELQREVYSYRSAGTLHGERRLTH